MSVRTRHLAGFADAAADRGFRHGMSVFETWAVTRQRPRLHCEHALRLERAARELLGPGAAVLAREAASAVHRVAIREGVARIYITGGPGGPADPVRNPAAWLFEEEGEVDAGPGSGGALADWPQPFTPAPGGWKTGSYWPHLRALAWARQRGAFEAALYNPGGLLIGCACANLFVQIGRRWLTPAVSQGARDGAVRAWVMSRLAAEEAEILWKDTTQVRAAFLTNSRVGIRQLAMWQGRPLERPAEICELASAYASEILQR